MASNPAQAVTIKRVPLRKATKKRAPHQAIFEAAMDAHPESVAPLARLSRDLDAMVGAAELTRAQARSFVRIFYQVQTMRKMAVNQHDAARKAGQPNDFVYFFAQQMKVLESNIRLSMERYAANSPVGRWVMRQYGFGPIIAAGLMAHIDITKAPYAGHVWSYAGMEPSIQRVSREKADAWVRDHRPVTHDTILEAAATFHRRWQTLEQFATKDRTGKPIKLTETSLAASLARLPWNKDLKVLCWKIADCVRKFSNRNSHDNLYGQLYRTYKVKALERNESGGFVELAAKTLETRRITDPPTLAIYKDGKIPQGRVDAWATRKVLKIFLSHTWQVMWETYHKSAAAPHPYILAYEPDKHHEFIPAPHWPLTDEDESLFFRHDGGDLDEEEM